MRMKIVVLLLILASILFAGCVGDEEPAVPEATPTETATEEATEIATETPTEVETPTEMETPTEIATETEEATPATEPKTWTIRLENFLSRPSELEINKGDTVVWMNFNDPIRQFTLVSKDGLWEDVAIGYRRSFTYTFEESGTFNYTVPGYEQRMSGSVIVK